MVDNNRKQFELNLNDAGKVGYRVESVNVYSVKTHEMDFGFYQDIVEANELYGNKVTEESPVKILLH